MKAETIQLVAGESDPATVMNLLREYLLALQLYDRPSLMAGKIHALITREYPKGRDWYDLLWYRGQRPAMAPNVTQLQNALDQTQGEGIYAPRINHGRGTPNVTAAADMRLRGADCSSRALIQGALQAVPICGQGFLPFGSCRYPRDGAGRWSNRRFPGGYPDLR